MKEELQYAQSITSSLFDAIESNQLFIPGKSESQLVDEIVRLAQSQFEISQYWHKKIVRVGSNTLAGYPDNPPNRILEEEDILFVDLGPVINGYEADFGRTYVIGNDATRIKIRQDVEAAWYELRDWCNTQDKIIASELYHRCKSKAIEYGWTFSGDIAGHIVGKYPHEQPEDPASPELDIHPSNHADIFQLDKSGNPRHWILELQFVDQHRKIGAYFEQLI